MQTAFLVATDDNNARLYDHASETEPPTRPAVMEVRRVLPKPDTVLQTTLERERQLEDSDAVDPKATQIDLSRFTDVRVTRPPNELKATFRGLKMLKNGVSKVNVSVKVPGSNPPVTTVRHVLSVPCCPRQRTPVSLTHFVASAAVLWTLPCIVKSYMPSPEPCTVTLTEPVLGMLVGSRMAWMMSMDKTSVRVPCWMPAVAIILVDVCMA